ncbi:molybdate transport system permease protein [Kytococcus aerolatus]|uniref:Molybdenum transport system permease n=1 Tax=Kytococcus aerolatus TaxID=592308 RepID=A0A212T917_9MICO|nr:ABC transporter permease [Kytococcus aerolatus]SNC62341.1 molybdate transport system permease protein [Kytococcus aerolatus]
MTRPTPPVSRRSGTDWSAAPLALLAAAAVALVAVPLVALLLRADWVAMPGVLGRESVQQALVLSLTSSSVATALSVLCGVPLAWWLAASDQRGAFRRRVAAGVRALVTLPLVLPPAVGGVALLMAFGRTGLLGQRLDAWFGVTLPFTPAAVVLAQTFVAMPFLVTTVDGALAQRDRSLEEAAWTCGADAWQTFRRVTLPLAAPSLLAGVVLCWARALGEFGATIVFAGNLPGSTQTMPLAVYLTMQNDPQAAVTLSVVLLLVSAAVIVALRGRWAGGLSRFTSRRAG